MAKRIDKRLSFFLDEFGETVVIDGQEKKALFLNVQDKLTYYDDKIIRTPFEIKTGDLVVYQNREWLVISEVDKNKKSYRARIRQANYHINFVLNGDLYTFPTIIEGLSAGLDVGQIIVVQDGKIIVTLPANDHSRLMKVDQRFITMRRAWKVVGVDWSKRGLILLHCELTLTNSNDDMENEIADVDKVNQWSITIVGANEQVAIGKEFIMEARLTKNGVVDTEEVVEWASSDETIATVDDGIVTGLQLGTVTITAYMKSRPTIHESVEVEVVESMPDIITYKMWSSNLNGSSKSYTTFSIMSGSEKLFGMEKYINGVMASPNETYSFHLNPNGASSSSYTYTVVNSHSVRIKANSTWSNGLILTGTSNSTGESILQNIKLTGLW